MRSAMFCCGNYLTFISEIFFWLIRSQSGQLDGIFPEKSQLLFKEFSDTSLYYFVTENLSLLYCGIFFFIAPFLQQNGSSADSMWIARFRFKNKLYKYMLQFLQYPTEYIRHDQIFSRTDFLTHNKCVYGMSHNIWFCVGHFVKRVTIAP